MQSSGGGPGRAFARHPLLFKASWGAAALATGEFVRRAATRTGVRRWAWTVLAIGQVAQLAGILWAQHNAQS